MSAIEKKHWTVEEYLAFENASVERHEFIDGEVYAMTGRSFRHAWIIGYTFVAFDKQLSERDCRVAMGDLRVLVDEVRGNYTYPDLTVMCGEVVSSSVDPDALTNPTVIVEVLSPSTEQYDRGMKFMLYQRVTTLQDYILITQNSPRVERYSRQPGNTWIYTPYDGLDAILTLDSIGCTIALADVYRRLPFDGIENE